MEWSWIDYLLSVPDSEQHRYHQQPDKEYHQLGVQLLVFRCFYRVLSIRHQVPSSPDLPGMEAVNRDFSGEHLHLGKF